MLCSHARCLLLRQAHQIHRIPDTPGPGAYTDHSKAIFGRAFGKQPLSKHKTDYYYSFGETPRFSYIVRAECRQSATRGGARRADASPLTTVAAPMRWQENAMRKNATPGPGHYIA